MRSRKYKKRKVTWNVLAKMYGESVFDHVVEYSCHYLGGGTKVRMDDGREFYVYGRQSEWVQYTKHEDRKRQRRAPIDGSYVPKFKEWLD